MKNNQEFTDRLFGGLDHFLSQTLRDLGVPNSQPAIKAYRYEADSAFRLRLDLPGFEREEISISLENRRLTIEAKSDRPDPFLPQVQQSFQLPTEIDYDRIEAKYQNGVLDLTFPKKNPENSEAKKIAIS